MPDFNFKLLRQLSTEMQRLAAIPRAHKDYATAQVALADLRTDYTAMKDAYQQQYATDPANPNRALAAPEQAEMASQTSDRGQATAGVLGGLRGLGGATGAFAGGLAGAPLGPLGILGGSVAGYTAGRTAVPLASQGIAAAVPGGVTGSDVHQQWQATEEASPWTALGGEAVGGLVGGAATRLSVSGATAIENFRKARATRVLLESKLAPEIAQFKAAQTATQTATANAAKVATTSSTVTKVGAQKAVATAQQTELAAAQKLAQGLARAQAEELAIVNHAKVTALVKQGFNMEDALQMVKTGVNVPKAIVEPMMRAGRQRAARGLPLLGS